MFLKFQYVVMVKEKIHILVDFTKTSLVPFRDDGRDRNIFYIKVENNRQIYDGQCGELTSRGKNCPGRLSRGREWRTAQEDCLPQRRKAPVSGQKASFDGRIFVEEFRGRAGAAAVVRIHRPHGIIKTKKPDGFPSGSLSS